MKLSLYKIEQEYLQLAEMIIASEGETTPEIEEALKINAENLQTKAVNYGFVCKELAVSIDNIDSEIERLNGLKKQRSKALDKLKSAISGAMQLHEIDKVETPVMKLSFRNSESVEIDNIDEIPAKFMVEKVTSSPDKKAIKAAIEAGELTSGAHIQQNKSLQIK